MSSIIGLSCVLISKATTRRRGTQLGGIVAEKMALKSVTAAGPRRAGVVVLLLVATARNVSAEMLRLVTICNASVRSCVQTLTDFRADARRC